jgi:hypothetical protein
LATSTLLDIGAKVLSSANAIHHYYDLAATLGSWVCVLRPGALVFVCSGNLRNPHTKLREKVFVPVRPLDQYPDAFPCNWTYITCPR